MKNLEPPAPRKEVRQFIVVVNYYRNIGAKHSHILAPSTNITSSKVKFKWLQNEQDALNEIKGIVACNNILAYTYFHEEFKIHTDASDFQLGGSSH